MRAPQAPTVIDVLIALHRLHLSRSVIGKLTGFSGTYVGMLLHDAGKIDRWDHVDDARADLPGSLRESCDRLVSARPVQPVSPRKALAIAQRLEAMAIIASHDKSG